MKAVSLSLTSPLWCLHVEGNGRNPGGDEESDRVIGEWMVKDTLLFVGFLDGEFDGTFDCRRSRIELDNVADKDAGCAEGVVFSDELHDENFSVVELPTAFEFSKAARIEKSEIVYEKKTHGMPSVAPRISLPSGRSSRRVLTSSASSFS